MYSIGKLQKLLVFIVFILLTHTHFTRLANNLYLKTNHKITFLVNSIIFSSVLTKLSVIKFFFCYCTRGK